MQNAQTRPCASSIGKSGAAGEDMAKKNTVAVPRLLDFAEILPRVLIPTLARRYDLVGYQMPGICLVGDAIEMPALQFLR